MCILNQINIFKFDNIIRLMVRVVGLTPAEKAIRQKKSKLLSLTEEVLPVVEKSRIVPSNESHLFYIRNHSGIGDPPITVDVKRNRVSIDSSAYRAFAEGLANAYEVATGQGFTVKKLYE